MDGGEQGTEWARGWHSLAADAGAVFKGVPASEIQVELNRPHHDGLG